MKKIIPFTKDIKFNTKIYEITSISLENTLTIDDSNQVDGEFIISGEYKISETSLNIEPFIRGLPFNITLDEYYDSDTLKVDIDNFKYEIVNEEILRVNIDVAIDGNIKIEKEKEEVITPDVIIDARKDEISKEDEKEDVSEEVHEERKITKEIKMDEDIDLFKEINQEAIPVSKEEKVTSIFENFDSSDEKYVSYYVHIMRENENIEQLLNKYKVSIDEIKKYNNIDKINLGDKIIIPYMLNEEL